MIHTDGTPTIANARETDDAKERRLIREAADNRLGSILAPGCTVAHEATDVCRVEVTRGNFTDDEGTDLRENAGFFIVFVKTTPGGEHPANIASDAVYGLKDGGPDDWDYFSVDEVYPA